MSVQTEKASVRARQLAWRAAQPEAERREAVDAAIRVLLAMPAWAGAHTIAAYAALPEEPDLAPLVRAAWASGKRVVLPIVAERHAPLRWREHTPDVTLIRGSFRVPVPPPTSAEVAAADVALVVVPALAVDPRGYRVGYGGGYYDRSLAEMPDAVRVWLGQPEQQVARVPVESTDAPVHWLVTRSGAAPAVVG